MKKTAAAVCAALIASLGLVGCGADAKGGNTVCKDFVKMSEADQIKVIKKMAKEEGTSLKDVGDTELKLAATGMRIMCKMPGADNKKLKELGK